MNLSECVEKIFSVSLFSNDIFFEYEFILPKILKEKRGKRSIELAFITDYS